MLNSIDSAVSIRRIFWYLRINGGSIPTSQESNWCPKVIVQPTGAGPPPSSPVRCRLSPVNTKLDATTTAAAAAERAHRRQFYSPLWASYPLAVVISKIQRVVRCEPAVLPYANDHTDRLPEPTVSEQLLLGHRRSYRLVGSEFDPVGRPVTPRLGLTDVVDLVSALIEALVAGVWVEPIGFSVSVEAVDDVEVAVRL